MENNKLWTDDNEDLSKRVDELETQVKEMLDRMRQYEAVLTTAFRIRDAGDWRLPKNKESKPVPNCECGNFHPYRTS